MAEITVDVGVRLKAMQSSVADLQKVLDGLQPNSSGFKALQKIIADINRDIDRLRIQTSKPFGSQNQFNQTGKTVDKLEESLEKVKITIDRIKFSDLKLDSSQTAQLDNFKQQLSDIKQEFTAFKADLKTQFLDNDFNKAFVEGINPNLINKNFDEIVKNVENRVNSLGSTLARAKADLEGFQNASKIGEKIDKASQSANGVVSSDFMGQDMFDKFFQTNSKGIFSFKTGGGLKKGEIQQQFLDYLAGEFQLNQSQIDQLKNQTASNIRKILMQDDFFNSQKNAAETANKKMSGAESNFTTASKNYENAVAVVARLNPLIAALTNEETSLEDKQKLVNQAIKQFEQDCVNGAKGSKTMNTALNGLDSQLNSFKTQLGQVNTQWLNLQKQQATFNSMKSAIVNFMGFNQVINLTKKAVKEAMDHIKQLDTVMNGIAIVTDMTTADLWNQVDAYSEMAQRYGTTIQGAYEVSKIYYQAGYETNDVLTLMNETLKLSKVSGLDYATTTDYMMTATRGFHMEVSEAAQVVDVYSALAANTAVSQQELAEAMSKTASSMESVGATFQESSAMIATMVAVTRESANNIGSALKSIGARYGELTKDPAKLFDAEGEAMSFNKVDTALKSVGISLQTADHQFRDFTDVIMELAGMWDTLDSAQQRYIATTFAGNRQQSRFLALVSNKDLLQENMDVAAASEDTGTLQALKALDSLESKLNQVRVAYQQFYTSIGVESVWKGALDGIRNFIDTLNSFPKLFGKIPVGAISVVVDVISTIKGLALSAFGEIANQLSGAIQKTQEQMKQSGQEGGNNIMSGLVEAIKSRKEEVQSAIKDATEIKQDAAQQIQIGQQQVNRAQDYKNLQLGYQGGGIVGAEGLYNYEGINALITKMQQAKDITEDEARALLNLYNTGNPQEFVAKFNEYITHIEKSGNAMIVAGQRAQQGANGFKTFIESSKHLASDLGALGSALNMIGSLINTTSRQGQIASGSIQLLAGGFKAAQTATLAFQAVVGKAQWSNVFTAAAGAVLVLVNAISALFETNEEKLKRFTKEAEEAKNQYVIKKDELKTLEKAIDKYEDLAKKQYDGVEAKEAFIQVSNDIAEQFPELIKGYNNEGDAIIDLAQKYEILALRRNEAAQAGLENANKSYQQITQQVIVDEQSLRKFIPKIVINDSGVGEQIDVINADTQGFAKGLGAENTNDLVTKLSSLVYNSTFQTIAYDEFSSIPENINNMMEVLRKGILNGSSLNFDGLNFTESVQSAISDWIEDGTGTFTEYLKTNNLYNEKAVEEVLSTDGYYAKLEHLRAIGQQSGDAEDIFDAAKAALIAYDDILNQLTADEDFEALEKFKEEEKNNYNNLLNITSSYSELRSALNQQDAARKQVISAQVYSDYIKAVNDTDESNNAIWSYYENSAEGIALLNDKLNKTFVEEGFTNPDDFISSRYQEVLNEFNESFGSFWANASDATRESFNTFYGNLGNYSKQQAEQIANRLGLDFEETGLNQAWEDASATERINKALLARQSQENLTMAKHALELDFIPNVLESQIKNVADIVNSYSRKGLSNKAQDLGINYISLIEAIQKNAGENSAVISSLLADTDLSFSSLQELKRTLAKEYNIENGPIIDAINDLESSIVTDITSQIATLQESISKNLKDTTSNIEKIGKGLDYSEALEIFEKIRQQEENIKFDDLFTFDLDLGQYITTSSDTINKYINAEQEILTENYENIKNAVDSASNFKNVNLSSSNYETLLADQNYLNSAIALGLESYIADINNAADAGDPLKLIQAISAYNKAWDELYTKNKTDLDVAERALGDVTSATELSSLLSSYNYEEYIKKLGSNLSVESFVKANQRELPGAKALLDQINTVYNSLISDIFSKGFENINLTDYQGLVGDNKAAIQAAIESGNYTNFVREYAAWAGKTIEETNDLIIQAIEKDSQKTTGAAAEAVGKIQWLSDKKGFASLGDIQNLADALGRDVNEILGVYNTELDAYEVDVSQIDLSNVDNFRDSVYDGINEFLKKVTDGISKGISGKLSSTDVTTLTGQLEQLGLKDLTLDFTKTVDGLKLSQRSAMELYNELKKIDALQAQLVFDELAKSLEASDTNYTNISTTLARIAELEKAIQGMKPDDARLQMYKNELAVAQEIARTRSSTDNKDFNFMDRALPTGMQNPIDYWNATGEAYKVMNASAKSGYMEIQDFYNIVQEMSNMAQVSGQRLHFMGQEIDGSAETAAALIQKGFSALTNVKGDGVKIALNNIGVDFKTGAADMKGDFDSGIRQMAKAQIQMLDAAINMLEAIVAMENIDIDQDGLFSFDELFNGGNAAGGWTKSAEDWFDKLDGLTGGIEVGGVDLKTALLNMAQSGDEGAERVKQFMNDLKNIDWTLGDVNVTEKVRQLVQGLFVGQDITQGTSIFEILDIPKNADRKTEEFSKWLEKVELNETQAGRLINRLQTGGDFDIKQRSGEKSVFYEAIEKILGLTREDQKEVLERFSGEDNKLTQEEIKLWSNIELVEDASGQIVGGTYTASDGSTLSLDGDAAGWQDKIADYERKITIGQHTGQTVDEITDNSKLESIVLKSGLTVQGVISATSGGYTASYNGVTSSTFKTENEARQWLYDLVNEKDKESRSGGAYNPELVTDEVTGETKIKYNYRYILEPGTNKEDLVEPAKGVKQLDFKKDVLPKILKTGEKGEDGNFTYSLDDIGLTGMKITSKPGEIEQVLTDSLNDIIGETDPFAGLPEKIAEGITTAFTQNTSIGEAIGTGIKTALTGTDENGQAQDVPLPTLTLKPESITIQADGITPTIAGVNENSNLSIPSVTVEAQNVLLTSTVEPNSEGLNIPTSISKEDLSIIYSALNLIGYKEDVNESGVYLPSILEKHPIASAYLAMLLLKSNNDTSYNGALVSNPSEELEKKFTAAAILAKLVLSSDENTDFIEGSISIGEEKQLKIKQVLEAIATGKIKINSPENGSSIEEGNIIIGEGENQLTLSQIEWTTAIDTIKTELSSNYQVLKTGIVLTENDLTLNPKELIQPISGIRYTKDKDLEEITKDIEKTKVKMPDPGSQLFTNDRNAAAKAMGGREAVQKYVDSLQDLVNKGFSLTDNQKENIEYIKEVFSGGINQPQPIEGLDDLIALSNANSDSFNAVNSLIQSLSTADIGDLPEIATTLQDIVTQAQLLEAINWQTIIDGINGVAKANLTTNPNTNTSEENGDSTSTNSTQTVVVEVDANTEKADEKITSLNNSIENETKEKPVDINDSLAKASLSKLERTIKATVSKNVDVKANITEQYNEVLKDVLKSEDKVINIKAKGSIPGEAPKAGNVALSKGTGSAYAAGNTLMGELGPELVVSKGRYFIVGQNGPEMVNLADDAIVFNHLQTQQLLKRGKASGHANPVTNERKATSLATGNASGPAMASASAALDVLKQLRAMWQSLADASLKDLGSMPGGSGGGGGGGGGDKTPAEIKSITQQVERWYNWMKEIEEIQTNLNKLSKEYTLLEKQHIASQTKLANLQNQQAETLRDINTRSGLIKEQKDYRSQEIARVTKEGSAFNAFYGIDEETGRIYLKNDDAANAGFKEFLKGTKSSLGNVMANEGKISAGTKIDYKQSYTQKDADEDYAAWLETAEGQKASKKQKKKKKKQLKKKVGKKINKTLTTEYNIRTGADLMNELQRKDKQGNNVHDAQEQYLLLDKLGIIEKMPELMAGIDKSQEGWQETAVENFYNAIDADKEAIETLNDSIKEQEEALLDDKIQMQEINDQIREIAKPLPGVTEGFEKWYNELKRIEAIQERINILSKQNSLLQNDHIANGKEIFLNYKQQEEELKNQLKANEDLYNKQVKGREDLVKKYQSLPIDYDVSTGTATFNEKKYNKSIKISHTDTKKNSLGYEVDEQGRYIDNKGILRDANGKELNTNTEIIENGLKTSEDLISKELKTSAEMFGQVQTTMVESTYNTNGKTLPQILEEITSQNANGETAYTAEEQYDILKGLEFEKLLQYDESGNQIYENFGELSKEQMKEAVEAGISRIQGAADEINEYTSDINKITEENLDIQNNLYEIESARIQNAIDLENLVKDAIVQERQDAIDAKKDLRDALDKAANKTVDGLKESLDREKALYDSDSDSKELTALQAQLTLLRSAGGSLGKIRDLESQIQDKQKDMYFAERENSIENLENAAQKQIDALDTQIDIMQTSLDYQVEQGLIWAEVNRKISTEGPDSLASYIVENQKGFLANSPTQQKEDLTEILQTAQFGKAQIEDTKNPKTPKKEEKQEPKKNQEKKESKPEPKKEESKNQPKTTSQPVTQPKAQTNLTTQQQNALKSDLQPHLVSDSPKDRPKTTEVEEPEKVTVTTVKKGLKYYSKKTANSKTKSLGKISKGTSFDVKGIGKTKTYTTSKKKKRYMLKAEIGGREVYVPLLYTWLKNGKDLESKLVKSKLPKFAKGGSVDFTGPAWVDGTKNKPEQIFNYDQMEQLRKMFLDNLTATQIGIAGLSSIADKLPNTNSYNSINNEDSGVNINQLDFHMEVEQISNDYDARRAGQAAMEEMVRIARKTGNRSISRR